ncbi:MAG: 4Fe-4S binding protein [Oscillospiraceae bacterium]|jgi:2-oxoglutarate ferredoxin oxidoreductase subunit delta|nr:4Fe-4S binding protein [Oscillospiraceae bacterium]
MKWSLNFDRCKGCGLCAEACPRKILAVREGRINKHGYCTAELTDEAACNGCALCAVMCPDCAIEIA